jgi:hypothetical protein
MHPLPLESPWTYHSRPTTRVGQQQDSKENRRGAAAGQTARRTEGVQQQGRQQGEQKGCSSRADSKENRRGAAAGQTARRTEGVQQQGRQQRRAAVGKQPRTAMWSTTCQAPAHQQRNCPALSQTQNMHAYVSCFDSTHKIFVVTPSLAAHPSTKIAPMHFNKVV